MKVSKAQAIDFIILTLRWYLAYYMADYGWGKITGEQFGVHDPALLDKPLKEIDKFYLAWHLFSLDKTFDIGVGIMQIAGAILIVINRTTLVGALLLLPILVQIFLIDLAFTTNQFGPILPLRLAGMILSDLAILFYYKDRIIQVWQNLTNGTTTKYKYKWWVFIFMPILGLATDLVIGVLSYPIKMIIFWCSK